VIRGFLSAPVLGGLLIACSMVASAVEFSGNVAAEALLFDQTSSDPAQLDNNLTMSFEPQWTGDWSDGDNLWSTKLFLRADGKDSERNHVDLRELYWLHLDGDSEFRLGVNTLFWGVTESQHLVDVVNQVDQVEGIDGEDKLGQPMIQFKHYEDWGVVDFLVLFGFRERTFQSINGRPRTTLVVDTNAAQYQSSDGKSHIDYAFRYSQTFDNIDLGLTWFKGTNREPILSPALNGNGQTVLVPTYNQMTQLGLDLQVIIESWTWKLELIHRETSGDSFEASTAGFEYTFYRVLNSDIDVGTLVEYSYENRSSSERGVFDRDLLVGARLAFNDVQSTDMLIGLVIDTEKQSRSFKIEGSRRVGDNWKGTIEAQMFSNIDNNDVLASFSRDDYLMLELARYF
jgi:hypothetical protein